MAECSLFNPSDKERGSCSKITEIEPKDSSSGWTGKQVCLVFCLRFMLETKAVLLKRFRWNSEPFWAGEAGPLCTFSRTAFNRMLKWKESAFLLSLTPLHVHRNDMRDLWAYRQGTKYFFFLPKGLQVLFSKWNKFWAEFSNAFALLLTAVTFWVLQYFVGILFCPFPQPRK